MQTMNEQDKPEFTVVDRRHTSPAEEAEATQTPEETSAPTEVPSDDERSPMLPEPGTLLAFAAMQMDAASFTSALIPIFDGYAWQAMGLVANPATGETKTDLTTAQNAIDCVQFLLSKAESQLTDAERREAHRRLSDLRLNYVQKRQS
jgi:hypothetical protein